MEAYMKLSMAWLLVVILSIAVQAQQNGHEMGGEEKFVSGGTIRLHLDAGGYTISPSDSNNIVVTYHANSSEQLGRVKTEIKIGTSLADVYVRDTPHSNFTATIEVPRRSNLWARLNAGELDVEDVEGDKDLEVWAGQISLEIPHPDQYGDCDASVTAGSLEASAFNVSKGGLFRSFHQQGPGKYRLHIHVTTGEIDMRGSE
jgi:hypothetical protein